MNVDSLLAFLLTIAIPFLLAAAGGALATRTLPTETKKGELIGWISAFAGLLVVGVILGVWQQVRITSQQKIDHDLAEADRLRSEGNNKYTQGQLDSINKTLASVINSSGSQGLTGDLLKGLLQASRGRQEEQITDAQLCKRTKELAQKIRTFENEFTARSSFGSEFAPQDSSPEARKQFYDQQAQKMMQGYRDHEAQFQGQFISDAKYDHDKIIDRIPAATRDSLVFHNQQAEETLVLGRSVGAQDENALATYLDELAKSLCK